MDEGRESGFINSQPSIAEFMTSVPLINEALQQAPSIIASDGMRSFCQSFTVSQQQPPDDPRIIGGDPGVRDSTTGLSLKFPDYAWMKEKKTVRKGVAPDQNELGITHFIINTPLVCIIWIKNGILDDILKFESIMKMAY